MLIIHQVMKYLLQETMVILTLIIHFFNTVEAFHLQGLNYLELLLILNMIFSGIYENDTCIKCILIHPYPIFGTIFFILSLRFRFLYIWLIVWGIGFELVGFLYFYICWNCFLRMFKLIMAIENSIWNHSNCTFYLEHISWCHLPRQIIVGRNLLLDILVRDRLMMRYLKIRIL